MNIKYLLIPTDRNSTPLISAKQVLSDVFSNVTSSRFEFNGVTFSYSENHDDLNNHCYLVIESNKKIDFDAKQLSKAHTAIKSGKHLKGLYIICVYNEMSDYYTCKMYPFFSKFERQIRHLTYILCIKTFGEKWADEVSITSKKESKKSLIQAGLEKLTLTELEDLLFLKKDISFEQYNSVLAFEAINTSSKEELVKAIDSLRPKSLWEKIFADNVVKEMNLFRTISSIKSYRNQIAHNKDFTYDDFKRSKEILKEVIPLLDESIRIVEARTFKDADKIAVLESMLDLDEAQLSPSLMSVMSSMARDFEKISKYVTQNVNLYNQVYTSAIEPLAKIKGQIEKIYTVQEANKSLSDFGNTISRLILWAGMDFNKEVVTRPSKELIKNKFNIGPGAHGCGIPRLK